LEYSVEVSGDEDRLKGPSPTLCLLLRPTREALRLSDTDYDDITVSDIAYDLNRQGVGPYDLPTKVGREGIEIIDAWWDGREPAAGPEVPAQANALTAEDLRAASEQWELGRRGPRDPRDLVGCKLFRADPRPNGLATERRVAVPPKPKVDVVRRSSWIEVSYEFTSLPPGQACLPYAVGGVVSSGGPVETRLVTEAFARVTGATGTLIVPLRLLHGERPERVEVTATAVTGFGSDVVSVPVGAPPD
jgi:hypothetical protein